MTKITNQKVKFIDRNGIEKRVRSLQQELWEQGGCLRDTKGILSGFSPQNAAEYLGFKFEKHMSLGESRFNRMKFEVAGYIDRQRNLIAISEKPKPTVQNFTAAHEVGHCVLHPNQEVMHRDRPVDGVTSNGAFRSKEEKEADCFAAFLLMPQKLVLKEFRLRFLSVPFKFDDDTAFFMDHNDVNSLLRADKNSMDRELALATCRKFNGQSFDSLAKIFGVSPLSMAIRLRELKLVEYP